jgi:hypothetical protein
MRKRSKKRAKRTTAKKRAAAPVNPEASPKVEWPDFAARRKQIFGDRVFEDFLKYRHREWELGIGLDPPLSDETRPAQPRRSARRLGGPTKG